MDEAGIGKPPINFHRIDSGANHIQCVASANLYQQTIPENVPLKRPVYIDILNVARSASVKREHNAFSGVSALIRYFIDRGHFVCGFMPISFSGDSNQNRDVELLQILIHDGFIIETPARSMKTSDGRRQGYTNYDDLHTLKAAVDHGGVVVSDDRYNDLTRGQSNVTTADDRIEFAEVCQRRLRVRFTDTAEYGARMAASASLPQRRSFVLLRHNAVVTEQILNSVLLCQPGDKDFAKVSSRQMTAICRNHALFLLQRIERDWRAGYLPVLAKMRDCNTGFVSRATGIDSANVQLAVELKRDQNRDLESELGDAALFAKHYQQAGATVVSNGHRQLPPEVARLLEARQVPQSDTAKTPPVSTNVKLPVLRGVDDVERMQNVDAWLQQQSDEDMNTPTSVSTNATPMRCTQPYRVASSSVIPLSLHHRPPVPLMQSLVGRLMTEEEQMAWAIGDSLQSQYLPTRPLLPPTTTQHEIRVMDSSVVSPQQTAATSTSPHEALDDDFLVDFLNAHKT